MNSFLIVFATWAAIALPLITIFLLFRLRRYLRVRADRRDAQRRVDAVGSLANHLNELNVPHTKWVMGCGSHDTITVLVDTDPELLTTIPKTWEGCDVVVKRAK